MDENTSNSGPKSLNFKDALSVLDNVNTASTFNIWVPSAQKDLIFKELNTKQQKELLQSIVDSPFYKTKFITTIYSILKENYLPENVINFEDLNLIDKQFIILKTRIKCFNRIYELDTNADVDSKSIDLNDLFEKAKTNIQIPKNQQIEIEGIPITITVGLPNIKTEYTMEIELHKITNTPDANNPDSLRRVLGEMFVGELSKYILSITFENGTIDFTPLKFKERIELLEKLPNKLIQKVIEYIDSTRKVIDSITTVSLKEKDTDKEIEEKFDIDGSFFAIK